MKCNWCWKEVDVWITIGSKNGFGRESDDSARWCLSCLGKEIRKRMVDEKVDLFRSIMNEKR